VKARRNNKELLREETDYLKQYLDISRVRTAQVAEGLLEYTDTFVDWDPLLVGVGPSNPWMTDDQSYWEINKPIPDVPTEKRVRRWAISLEDIIMDPLGVQELLQYMKKEYSHENLRFWLAVQELKRGPGSDTKIKKKVKEIFEEFLSKGAKAEINIDGKTMEETRIAMKTPSRYTYDKAADHVYLLLLKKDCYPRFIRSDHYKNLLAYAINPGSSRKRFFNFPQVRKKISQNHPPNAPGQPGQGGQNGNVLL
jgi:regulator of G-protein signaling